MCGSPEHLRTRGFRHTINELDSFWGTDMLTLTAGAAEPLPRGTAWDRPTLGAGRPAMAAVE